MWTPVKARITITAKKPRTSVAASNPFAALASLTEEEETFACNVNIKMPANLTVNEKLQVIHDS